MEGIVNVNSYFLGTQSSDCGYVLISRMVQLHLNLASDALSKPVFLWKPELKAIVWLWFLIPLCRQTLIYALYSLYGLDVIANLGCKKRERGRRRREDCTYKP